MGIPLAALSVRPPEQPPDAIGQAGKAIQLRSLLQAAPLQQQALQQQVQAGAQENQLRDMDIKSRQALQEAGKGLDWTQPDTFGKFLTNAQANGAAPQVLSQLATQRAAYNEQIAKTDTATLTAEQTRSNLLLGHIDAIKGIDDPVKRAAAAQSQASQILNLGLVKDPNSLQMVQAMAQGQKVPTDDELKQYEVGLTDHKTQVANALEERKVSATEQEAQAKAQGAETSAAEFKAKLPGGPLNRVTQDIAVATNPQIQAGKINVANAEGQARFNLQQNALGDPATDQAAQRYLQTGQLPAGMRSPGMSAKIINRAGEIGGGQNIAANSAEFHANSASYQNVTKTLDTLSAFEGAANKNIDQFTSLLSKIPDTGVPWLNTPIRKLDEKLVGAEYMPAINAARGIMNREIARVTSDPKLSGALSDHARAEVMDMNPADATLPQIAHVVTVLKQDMANVHSSLGAQKDDIGKRLGVQTPAAATPSSTTPSAAPAKTLSMAQIQKAAKDHGVSVEEATRQAKAAGYGIQ